MLFNSIEYAIFLPLVAIAYFLIPFRFRWALLLAASCYFYMCFIPVYILILLLTILVDYFAAQWIEKTTGREKKIWLILSVLSTCLILAIFKYADFLISNLNNTFGIFDHKLSFPLLNIILPIGLSFHTFQSLSYIFEVYRGNQKAENNFGIYALYVMFFPQLVAGPIERSTNLLHQFYKDYFFDYNRVTSGLKLIIWGLFKKVVIADRLAIYVNQVYNNPSDYHGLPLIIATYFFAFQIYCDFSGYSDIAIGSARILGFKLILNFDKPYMAKSIREFWYRWHISLSSWFRDYLYIPLGGNRTSKFRWCINILVVFLISGLWHGANWTFVVWGTIHGFYILFTTITLPVRKKITDFFGISNSPLFQYLSILATFHLVVFAWIFFRANSLSDAFIIISNLFDISTKDLYFSILGPFNIFELFVSIMSILFLLSISFFKQYKSFDDFLVKKPFILRWSLYYCLLFSIITFGVFEKSPFIYFQF